MNKKRLFAIAGTVAGLVILVIIALGTKPILSQTAKPVTPHTVIYLVREHLNGTLKSERIVSRSVNEKGEWFEEILFPKNGKSKAILEDGHYLVDQQTGDKVQFNSATPLQDCTGWANKMKVHAKETIEIAGLTAYVVGGEEVGDKALSYERAYALETGCTPLRVRVKSNDGPEITYEALQVIFSVNSNFGKDKPVTKDLSKD